MKKKLFVIGAMLLLNASLHAWNGEVTVSTTNPVMVLHADEGEERRMV